MAVGADNGQVANSVIEAAGDGANYGVGRKKPVLMQERQSHNSLSAGSTSYADDLRLVLERSDHSGYTLGRLNRFCQNRFAKQKRSPVLISLCGTIPLTWELNFSIL